MKRSMKKEQARKRRHRRVRGRINGTPARPRLVVTRSGKQISGQVIDDIAERTIASASSAQLDLDGEARGWNVAGARLVGEKIAQAALDAGVKQVAFDRAGHRYHGRIKAFAEAAREAGLSF